MHEALAGKRIVLGVTGGIAAYKAADLASKLVQLGADVHVVMTPAAQEFIRPFTFRALTRNPVLSSVFEGWNGDGAGHVTLAATADIVMVAPATANTIAKMANGLADDMLGAILLATAAPMLIAPAMEHHMWHHPATQANLATLMDRGARVISPEEGRLASGAYGDGRLAQLDRILVEVRRAVGADGPLHGRTVVVTAGGTHEAIDPVRFIGNGSSGTMGVALAMAAIDAGAEVRLILGPSVTTDLAGIEPERVLSALEMHCAVQRAVIGAAALIMAAAVADFRPASPSPSKLKKKDGEEVQTIELVKNPDIIASVQQQGLVKVGFAAETDDLIRNAQFKLATKGLDMIVANDAVATIGSPVSQATILTRTSDEPDRLPEMAKDELAREIIARVAQMIHGGGLG